jgi:hypothetical protein
MKTVLLRHPQTTGVWACPVAAVDDWLAKGWERQPAPDQTTDAAPAVPVEVAVAPAASKTGKDK